MCQEWEMKIWNK